jgi:HTH-type transcriptional regulator/antitoxin HipB
MTSDNVTYRGHQAVLITTPRDIGAAIKERRKQLGLGQAELATRAGVSRQWLIQLEGGKPGVAMGLVLRLLNVLGMRLMLDGHDQGASFSDDDPLDVPDPSAILSRHRAEGPQ